jgi:hypothetical protein
VQVGSEKLVDDAAGRCIEDLYPTRVVAKNNAVLTHAQTRQTFKAALKRLRVATSIGQTKNGGLHSPAGFRRKGPLVFAHLVRDGDSSQQERMRDGT